MKFGWREALGIALSALLLWWALSDVEWAKVGAHLRGADVRLLLASVTAATLTFPLRALRWRPILAGVAPNAPLGPLWRAVAIGMMVTNVVPARAGELARAYAVSREVRRISFPTALASIVADRVFDAFVVLLLMLVAMFHPDFPREQHVLGKPVGDWLVLAMLVFSVATAVLYAFVFFPTRLIALYELLVRRLSPRLAARGRQALLAFGAGLSVLRHPGRFVAVFAWTVAHWLMNALSFYLAFRAVGIGAPFAAALLLQGLIGIGIAIPSSPGFFGTFEALAKAGLPLYGVDETHAISWAILFHLASYIPITAIGAYYFTRLGLHFRELRQAEADGAPAGGVNAPPAPG